MIINLKDRIENTHYCISCDDCRVFIPRQLKESWVSDIVLDVVLGLSATTILNSLFKFAWQYMINFALNFAQKLS